MCGDVVLREAGLLELQPRLGGKVARKLQSRAMRSHSSTSLCATTHRGAVEFYQQSAVQGYGRAQFNLGNLYREGLS